MPVSRPTTQEIVFGGLMAAMTIALAAPLGPLVPAVLALPVALAFARHGPRCAIWTALVAAGGCLMLYDLITVVGFVIPSGILAGLGLGWGAWNHRPAAQTVALATAANLAGWVGNWYLALLFLHQNPSQEYQASITWLMTRLSASDSQYATLSQAMEPILRRGLPASALLYSLLMACAAYVVALLIFRRLGHPLPPPPPLQRATLPAWSAALMLLTMFGGMVQTPGLLGQWWASLSANVSLILTPLFLLQGALVAGVLATGAGLGRFAAFIAVAVVLFTGAAVFLGLFDSLLGLRRRAVPPART